MIDLEKVQKECNRWGKKGMVRYYLPQDLIIKISKGKISNSQTKFLKYWFRKDGKLNSNQEENEFMNDIVEYFAKVLDKHDKAISAVKSKDVF